MEELNLEELKQEATELGVEFSDRIGAKTLKDRIDKFYEKEAESADIVSVEDIVEVKEVVADTKAKKRESDLLELDIDEIKKQLVGEPALMHKIVMKKIDIEARKTQIVKLTMVDKREASTATDTYFNNGTLAMRVPLDVYVEMPNGLIEAAEAARSVIHIESNGVTTYKYTKKFVVDYKNK